MAEVADNDCVYEDDVKSHSQSLSSSSDQLIDPWCDQCYDHGSQLIKVEGFCIQCNNFLCKSCIEGHRKVLVLQNHIIQRGPKMPASQAAKPIKYRNCAKHDRNVNDRFCFDHSSVACNQCLKEYHQHCKSTYIPSLCKDLGMNELRDLKTTIDEHKNHLMNAKSLLERNITDIEKQRKQINKEINILRDKLLEEVQNLWSRTLSKLNDICRTQCMNKKDRVSSLADLIHSLDRMVVDIDKIVIHANFGPNQFIGTLDIVKKAKLYESQTEKVRKTLNPTNISFSLIPEISQFLSKCKLLGNVTEVSSEIGPVMSLPTIIFPKFGGQRIGTIEKERQKDILPISTKTMTPVNCKTSKDTRTCNIWGMDISEPDSLLLADFFNESLKIFSCDSKSLQSLSLPDCPFDVKDLDDKRGIICTRDSKLHIFDISNPAPPTILTSISLQFTAYAVTVFDNNLVIICDDKLICVKMINMNGKELWSTSTDYKEQPLFSSPQSATAVNANNKRTIIVSDCLKDTLTILEPSKGEIIKVIDVKGKGPRGLTTDDVGNVYTCYYNTREICVWSADLTRHRVLLSGNELKKPPHAIAYSKTTDEIFVSYLHSDLIDRFHLT